MYGKNNTTTITAFSACILRSLCVIRRVHVFYQCCIVYSGTTYCGPRHYIYTRGGAGTIAQVRVFRLSQKTPCYFLHFVALSLSPTHSLRLSLPTHPLYFQTTESACSFVTTEWSHANVRAQSAAYNILYIVVVCLFLFV